MPWIHWSTIVEPGQKQRVALSLNHACRNTERHDDKSAPKSFTCARVSLYRSDARHCSEGEGLSCDPLSRFLNVDRQQFHMARGLLLRRNGVLLQLGSSFQESNILACWYLNSCKSWNQASHFSTRSFGRWSSHWSWCFQVCKAMQNQESHTCMQPLSTLLVWRLAFTCILWLGLWWEGKTCPFLGCVVSQLLW